MKKQLLFYSTIIILIFGCSGSTEPSLKYIDNTRIILEGYIINQTGTPIANHKIVLRSRTITNLLTVYTDGAGHFFLSTPQANYPYSLHLGEFSIISSERFSYLLKIDPMDTPNFIPTFENIQNLYYNFGIIKIKKP